MSNEATPCTKEEPLLSPKSAMDRLPRVPTATCPKNVISPKVFLPLLSPPTKAIAPPTEVSSAPEPLSLSPFTLAMSVHNGQPGNMTPKNQMTTHRLPPPTAGRGTHSRQGLSTLSPGIEGLPVSSQQAGDTTLGLYYIAYDASRRFRLVLAGLGVFHGLQALFELLPSKFGRRVLVIMKLATCVWFVREMQKTMKLPSAQVVAPESLATDLLSPSPFSSQSRSGTPHQGATVPGAMNRPFGPIAMNSYNNSQPRPPTRLGQKTF